MGFFDIFKKAKNESHSIKVNEQLVYSNEYNKPQLGPFDSLYSTVVFLNAYKHSPILQEDKYYRYTYTELGINKPIEFHKKLISQGYLVADEKSENYILSEKGKDFLKTNNECCLVHKYKSKWDITWDKYILAKNKLSPNFSFTDVMWSIFNERQAKNKNLDSWTYVCMHELLLLENKQEQALENLLKFCYLEFNNINYYNNYLDYKKGEFNYILKENMMSKKDVLLFDFFLSARYIKQLKKLSDYINDDMIKKVCSSFPNYQIKICNEQNFKKYINQILNDTFDEEKAEKALKRNWNKLISLL